MERPNQFVHDIAVVGGCGHVGLPLGLAFADSGLDVKLFDTNAAAVDMRNNGWLPFAEADAPDVLSRVLASGLLSATTDAETIDRSEHVVVVVGTPVDRYLSPDVEAVARVITPLTDHLVDGHHVVLRSTVYPGVTERVARLIARVGRDIDVSFCP